ncbi:MAG: hypothetical protein PX634_22595 [Microcystis sp. M53600_WE12]|nr:hypothetical protein [Microcystis sp. M53600_WE12]
MVTTVEPRVLSSLITVYCLLLTEKSPHPHTPHPHFPNQLL